MRRHGFLTAARTLALLATGCGDDGGPAAIGGGSGGASPDDVETAIDDALDGVLDDLADGSLDETDLGDLMESAEDMAESFGDSGSGTVTINGDTIEFTSEICFAGQGDFTIEGAGTTGDGTPVWVSISQSVDTRAELLEFFDEAMLDQLYGDADPIIESSMSLEYGKAELFGSGSDDLPDFDAASAFTNNQIEMTVDGQTATGSGEASDFNYVAGDFDTTFPFTFTAGCG
jgi:hypothetical protein